MTQFRDRTLSVSSLVEVARHVDLCAACHDQYREAFRETRGPGPAWFSFSSDEWLRDEHLEPAQMAAYVGGRADEEEREIFEAHLRQCEACRDALSRAKAPGTRPAGRAGWTAWLRGGGRPVWALPALALLLLALLWGAGRWYRNEAPPTVKEVAGGGPAPVETASPRDDASSPQPEAPPASETLVARVRRANGLTLPPILEDLMLDEGMTRSDPPGEGDFRPLSPPQEVVAETRPTLRWYGLQGATGYRISLAPTSDWQPIVSPVLDASARAWTPPAPLRRGETYTWIVEALTPDGSVRVPPTDEPERRFKTLDARGYARLRALGDSPAPRLDRAILRAELGMLREAEAELLQLPQNHPDAPLIARLLAQIDAWKRMQP